MTHKDKQLHIKVLISQHIVFVSHGVKIKFVLSITCSYSKVTRTVDYYYEEFGSGEHVSLKVVL